MVKDLINYFDNKKILILGFGREGHSTYNLIRKHYPSMMLYISDENTIEIDDENVLVVDYDNTLLNLDCYDIVMKSPGVVLKDIDTTSIRSKIKSELELFLEFMPNFSIGITGTKGKSTTSSLIYEILKDQNKDVKLMGNIGIPVFDEIENLNDDTYVVIEMSSHQLEFTDVSPNIAIILNIFPDHLDHHNYFEEYVYAKFNIAKYQKENDYFLYNSDNENIQKYFIETKSKNIKVSMKDKADIYLQDDNVIFNNEVVYNRNEKRNLVGDYALNNIMFIMGVVKILDLDINKAKETIRNFKPLKHRLELFATIDDISYYDNTIATIPEATIAAVEAIGNVDTLIIGGMDRGLDYSKFIEYLNNSNISNIICMPKTGHDIAKSLVSDKVNIVETLEEAVQVAKSKTAKGKSCLLSPAAASYGFFKNFEEKGDKFQEIVKSTN